MKKLYIWLIFLSVFPATAEAQTFGPFTISSSACVTPNLPSVSVGTNQSTGLIYVSGTFSLTLQPAGSVSGQAVSNIGVTSTASGSSSQATITSTGTYRADVSGLDYFQVCPSAYTSGTATIYLKLSTGVSTQLIGGASNGGVSSLAVQNNGTSVAAYNGAVKLN